MKNNKTLAHSLPYCALIALMGATASTRPSAKGPVFLAPDAISVVKLLPAPASHGSAEEQAELKTVLNAQESRSPQDVERASSEESLSIFVFADVLGPDFNAKKCPLTADLFKSVEADAKFFSRQGKNLWNRPRPPYVDSSIHPSVTLENEGSYPSSHGTRGMLYAEILAQVFPEHRDALVDRGRQIGWDRVIGGVHYPSDIVAGRVLGQAILEKLDLDSAFQAQLSSAADEIKSVLKTQASVSTPAQ